MVILKFCSGFEILYILKTIFQLRNISEINLKKYMEGSDKKLIFEEVWNEIIRLLSIIRVKFGSLIHSLRMA